MVADHYDFASGGFSGYQHHLFFSKSKKMATGC